MLPTQQSLHPANPLSSGRTDVAEKTSGLSLEAIAFSLYLMRDAFGGVFRYYSSIFHVEAIWFLPDAVAVPCLVQFFMQCVIRNRSMIATLVLLQVTFSLALGYFFLGSFNGLLSSFKMMLPVFVGFCFCDSKLDNYTKLLQLITATFYLSIFGVFLTYFRSMPWVGFKYEAFGAVREAGRLWWGGSEQRLSGFAAESTMVAFFILITFVVASIRRSLLWCIAFGGVAIYAIKLSTSKTTMLVLVIYLALLVVVRLLPERAKFQFVRKLALWSFASILIPIFLIVFVSGTSVGKHQLLFSLMDRIDNSWQLPFVYMSQLMPIGLVTGCGVGCFNYPMQLFSYLKPYWVPVDNFYIGTYLMFGLPFVAFMWTVFRTTFFVTDIYKLSLIFVINLFTITVLCYGPACGLLIISICFCEVFSRRSSELIRSSPQRLGSRRRIDPSLEPSPSFRGQAAE
jgi:hypothetical protein